MSVRILTGDVRDMLATLPDESVHCVVTSPPYWGLRDYGVDGQIGMEPTMGEHIDTMVDVFREVRRVMRKDATCWLNYGDCYATSPNGRSAAVAQALGNDDRTFRDKPFSTIGPIYDPMRKRTGGGNNKGNPASKGAGLIVAGGALKPKDLCMIPNRLAIALQNGGWWVRSEIIWNKPNPMPESVTDRPATAHEKIWLLSKSGRYFYDAEAVRQPEIMKPQQRLTPRQDNLGAKVHGQPVHRRPEGGTGNGMANLRNVWTIPTKGFSGAHYATFPPDLIVPCIKAGTSEKGCCAECGAPWVREIEDIYRGGSKIDRNLTTGATRNRLGGQKEHDAYVPAKTTGWSPSCACASATIPCTVLDPFIGSGTTAMVADRLGRDCIGIDLNPANVEMATERMTQDAGMFAEVS